MPTVGMGILDAMAQAQAQQVLFQQQASWQHAATAAQTTICQPNTFFTTSSTSSTSFINTYTTQIYEIDEVDYMTNQEYFELARQRGIQFRVRTAEETRLRNEAIERARLEAKAKAQKRKETKAKAQELLIAHLGPDQIKTFNEHKWFIVKGGKTKTKYRIRTDYGIAGNIEVLGPKSDRRIATLCCHCPTDIPEPDHHLAQALCLQYDEEAFLAKANRRAAG